MKFHGIQMTGKFIIQKVTSLPTWTTADEGRIIYDTTERKMYVGSDQSWAEAGGGGGYGLPITNFVDNGQLEAGKMYMIDTSSGSLDANLEASPNLGDTITVVDVSGTFDMYPLTVYGNGQTIHHDAALEADIKDVILIFVWTGTSWKLDVGGIVLGGSSSGTIAEYSEDFTASAGMTAFVDTRGGVVTVTMPAENTLSTGSEITIIDQYNYFNTNKVICVSTQAEFDTGASTYELTNDGSRTTFMWDAGSVQWKVEGSVDLSGGIGNIENIDSDYNAQPGDFLFLDTSNNPITITLPPSGQIGSKAIISIYDQKDKFDINNVTINPAFGTIDLGQSSYTVNTNGVRVDFIWDDQQEDWKLDIGGDISSVLGGSGSGGMSGSNPVSATGNLTASVGDFLFCDTTGGSLVVTLPNANVLSTGDCVSIMDLKGTFNASNVIVNPVNATIGDDTNFVADINQMRIDFIYNAEVGNWLMDIGGALITGTGGGVFNTATEADYGLTRLATVDEVIAGTATNKVVTPASLTALGLAGATVWTPITVGQLCDSGSKYMVDTTSAPITMTLPTAPVDGNSIVFSDGGDFSTNNLTIARNGKTIEELSEDMVIDTENMSFELIYYNNDWKIA